MAIPNNQYIPTIQEKNELSERLERVMNSNGHDVKWIQEKYKISASPIINALKGGTTYRFLHDSTIKVLNKYFEEFDKESYKKSKESLFSQKIKSYSSTPTKSNSKFKITFESEGVLIEKELTENNFNKLIGITFNN